MKNNAHINCRLEDLLEILDARRTVNIFISEKQSVKLGYVYEILADKDFIQTYGNNKIIGLSSMVRLTNILLKAEEA